MKPNIHPEYKKLKITIGEDVFETYSAHRSGEILMDVDFRKHPAWTGDVRSNVNQSSANVSKFNGKFAGLTFGMKSSSS